MLGNILWKPNPCVYTVYVHLHMNIWKHIVPCKSHYQRKSLKVLQIIYFLAFNVKICLHPTSITPIHHCMFSFKESDYHSYIPTVSHPYEEHFTEQTVSYMIFGWYLSALGLCEWSQCIDSLMADKPVTLSNSSCRHFWRTEAKF